MSCSLFSLFINDLELSLSGVEMHAPCLDDKEIKLLLYADDCCFISQTQVGLQRGINKLQEYCKQWSMKVNINKTKIIVFGAGNRRRGCERWWYNKQEVEVVNEYRYLGVMFERNGNWNRHVAIGVKQTKAMVSRLRNLMYTVEDFPTELLIKIFNTMIEPVLTYGSEVWGAGVKKELVNSVGAKFCKMLLGIGPHVANCAALIEVAKILTSATVEKRMLNFFCKTYHSNKVLQKKCIDYQLKHKIKGWWSDYILKSLSQLKLEEVHLSSYTKTTKMRIRQAVESKEWEIINQGAYQMTSLRFFNNLRHERTGAEYIVKVGLSSRRVVARFRTGAFIWEAEKRMDGSRMCCLCGGAESAEHLLTDCPGLNEAREKYLKDFEGKSAVEITNFTTPNSLCKVVSFLALMFQMREAKLKV